MATQRSFSITSDAETVNSTFSVHQIDLDTMLHNGECQPEDEIIFNVEGDRVECFFKNGGHLISPGKDKALATALWNNQEILSIYE
jgi:hypothetical protein